MGFYILEMTVQSVRENGWRLVKIKKLLASFYTMIKVPRGGHREFCKRFSEIWTEMRHKRTADGNVPNVNWNDGKVRVNNWNLDNANDNVRFRPEVSRTQGVLNSFLRYKFEPAVCHFGNLNQMFGQTEIGFCINDVEFLFSAD